MQGHVTKLGRQRYEIGHLKCHVGHYVEHRRLGEAAMCLFIHQPSEEFPYRRKQQGVIKAGTCGEFLISVNTLNIVITTSSLQNRLSLMFMYLFTFVSCLNSYEKQI